MAPDTEMLLPIVVLMGKTEIELGNLIAGSLTIRVTIGLVAPM
jgi:hypothetical protein